MQELILPYNPDIQRVVLALDGLIVRVFPDAVRSQDRDNLGYGFGTGYQGLVFVITPYRDHVNLGVANGASLEDPSRLLQGAGKRHRHVKLRTEADAGRPEVGDLIRRALSAARVQISPAS